MTNAIKWQPLTFEATGKALRKSQFQNQPKFLLRRWIWQHTRLEVETATLLLVLGMIVLAAVWITMDQI